MYRTWAFCAAFAIAATAPAAACIGMEVTIVVKDQPITGELLPPATEEGFSFRLAETGHMLKFKWADLGEPERKRVQKMMGMMVNEAGRPVFGRKMKGTRLTLSSGKTVEGLVDESRCTADIVMLRTATAPSLPILRKDITNSEEFDGWESEFFSPREVYDRLCLEKPPQTAQDHYEMAKTCAAMTLYETALHHIDIAVEKDELMKERIKDFQAELVKKLADQQAERLYQKIIQCMLGEDYDGANELIERLARNFPNSDYVTKARAMQPDVLQKRETDLERRVITSYYRVFGDLLEKKVNSMRKDGPSIPGKLVTDRNGNVYKGVVKAETDQETVLQNGNLEIRIAQGDIISKIDVDLNTSGGRPWTFTELKDWATGTDSGLGKEIVAYLAKTLKITDAEVRRIWDNRLNRVMTVKDGKIELSPVYTTRCEAYYGRGSWLREGAQPLDPKTGQVMTPGSGGSRRPRQPQPGQPNQQDEDPRLSTDPDKWWTTVSPGEKVSIMRAIAAEKLFSVEARIGRNCPECGGTGYIRILNAASQAQSTQVCPLCRGLRQLMSIIYR